MKLLILGVNGFIGSSLIEKILKCTDWEIIGMDINTNKISEFLNNKRFSFFEGDINLNKEWVEQQIISVDVVIPLVAIANPALYIKEPLLVFQLAFEANLEIVRQCVKYQKRIIFPSTSEVYGMSSADEFLEDSTNLVLGPIHKQRWIYSSSKQLLDRIIYAYGEKDHLDYTIFRPFNWVGPKLDQLTPERDKCSRVVTQFISDILFRGELRLVDGGAQKRSFTCIDDGIDALLKIIENKNGCASKQIFNIGNPNNNYSIKELAEIIVNLFKEYPKYEGIAGNVNIVSIDSEKHYGKGYEDLENRVPSIQKAKQYLEWSPKIGIREALKKTLDYHLI